jgi:hypothetical protein
MQPHDSQCKRVAQQPCCTKNIRTVLILCNRLCKLSMSTIDGQPVAQHAMLRNMIDREWAPALYHETNKSNRLQDTSWIANCQFPFSFTLSFKLYYKYSRNRMPLSRGRHLCFVSWGARFWPQCCYPGRNCFWIVLTFPGKCLCSALKCAMAVCFQIRPSLLFAAILQPSAMKTAGFINARQTCILSFERRGH